MRMIDITSKRNFLFDLDGTLIDSSHLHALAFKEVLRRYDPKRADDFDYERMKGRRTRDVFLALGITEQFRLAELVAAKQVHYRTSVQQGRVSLCPGARNVLELLRSTGRRSFVVTGASRVSAEQALACCGIRGAFEGVVSSDDVQHTKPHPQIFLHCLAKFQLDRSASLVVEDAIGGVAGAHAAGIDVVLVNNALSNDTIPSFADLHAFAECLTAHLERSR